jgi:hypothetical protein
MFPFASGPDEMNSPEYKSRQAKCRGMLILWESPPHMGAAIGKTLAFFFVAAFVIAYLAALGLPRGATFLDVFRFVTTAGLLTHVAAHFPHVYWFRRRVAMEVLDGVAYAVATGLVFASLWPATA